MKTQTDVRRPGALSVEEIVRATLSAPTIETQVIDQQTNNINEVGNNGTNDSSVVEQNQPFYVVDIQDILKKHKNWTLNMPRVRPYYAVKCNSCPIVLELLASLGIGFDCASKAEIDSILELGVSSTDIIYANPCKTKSFVQHAYKVGVDLMTFDNEAELHKIAANHPTAKMVLRIKVDDSHAVCRFSAKFGAEVNDAYRLLTVAKQLNVDVVGVSFHVGSGCEDASSYRQAIADAHYVFNLARSMGFNNMSLLDLGGGWPGTTNAPVAFEAIAKVVCDALETYFPEEDDEGNKSTVAIIAEPGRYYVASAFTLATQIIAKRDIVHQGEKSVMYYLNDGVYGSFNCTIFDHWVVEPTPFLDEVAEAARDVPRQQLMTTLWGPTCDSMDMIRKDIFLPEMEIGEWIIFKEMGAYTIAAASTFNGFQLPSLKYHLPTHTFEALRYSPKWIRLAKVIEIDPDSDTEGYCSASDTDEEVMPQPNFEVDHLDIPVH